MLSVLLATVVDIGLLTVREAHQCHHSDARPIPATASRLQYGLCHLREILPNILVNNSTCVLKIFSPKILFDHVEYVSQHFAQSSATFFLS